MKAGLVYGVHCRVCVFTSSARGESYQRYLAEIVDSEINI